MIIHQMLHGYNHGHNYIQGSVLLDSTHDMAKIATLSDWSEYMDDENQSYLTTYPLEKTGYYVIAKTWYASEKSRPGCVWTHSLLIRKEDLVNIVDFKRLQLLFQRPSNPSEYSAYSEPIEYDVNSANNKKFSLGSSDRSFWNQLYWSLFSGDKLVEFPIKNIAVEMQNIILHFFNYIPTAILSRVNACTGTIGMRPYFNQGFTILFSSSCGLAVTNQGIEVKESHALGRLVEAVMNADAQMSLLLRNFDDELGDSLEKFKSFLLLVDLLNQEVAEEGAKEKVELKIIEVLSQSYPQFSEGRRLKQRFLSRKVSDFFVDEETFLYFMCIVDNTAFSKSDINFDDRLEALIETSKEKYYYLLWKLIDETDTNDWGKSVLLDSINHLDSNDYQTLVTENWYLYLSLVNIHFDILNDTCWMNTTASKIKDILDVLEKEECRKRFTKYDDLLATVYHFRIPIDDVLALSISENANDFVSKVLEAANSTGFFCGALLLQCVSHQKEVVRWLERTPRVSQKMVTEFIIKNFSPSDSFFRVTSPSLWRKVIYNIPMSLDYYIFLFVLSYNWYKEIDAISFLKKSFMPIYNAVINSQISTGQWRKIEYLMEPLKVWQDWDKGKKMRKTVGKRLKEAGLPKTFVASFTSDDKLNHEILKYWKKY